MKLFLRFMCFILFTMIIAGCGGQESNKQDEEIVLKLGHALSPGTAASDEINDVTERITELTEGRVSFDIYENSQLGSETEMLQQMEMGALESSAIMVGSMQTLDIRMAIEDLPYMWSDIDTARAAYDGEFGEHLAGIMGEHGMTQIGYFEWGFRHITNNSGPIIDPPDVENLSIRVAETPLRVDTFEQLGAIPTVMAFSEVYGALQQGTLDSQENPLSNIVAPGFYEVQDYASLTGHFYNTVMLMVETEKWEEISPSDQDIILDEMEKSSDYVQKQNDEMEESYVEELEENGMEVNDNVNVEAFRNQLLPIYDEWEEDAFGEELMDIYREASGWEE